VPAILLVLYLMQRINADKIAGGVPTR